MRVEGKVAASENYDDVSQPLVHFSNKSQRAHSFGTRTSVRTPLVCVPKTAASDIPF